VLRSWMEAREHVLRWRFQGFEFNDMDVVVSLGERKTSRA